MIHLHRCVRSPVRGAASRVALPSLALAFAATLLPAQYIEDRDNRNPTGTAWVMNATTTTLGSIVSAGNRLVDIEVTSVSPTLLFAASYVPNTGSYAKGWWYYYGLTAATLTSLINTNQARITDLEPYETSSGLRFAVLMESNATNGKGWWWYYNTSTATIYSAATANGARVVDLEQYTLGSTTYFAAVMIKNTGGDAKSWWSYLNVSAASVNSYLATNQARVWDLDRLNNGNYNVTMVRFTGEYSWYYYGQNAAQVTALLTQYGGRLIDVEQYFTLAGTRFDIAFTSAVNSTTARTRDAMLGKSNGIRGFYLRRVPLTGSSFDLAFIHAATRFEPASTLKTLHLVRTMREIYVNKSVALTTSMNVTTATSSTVSCPYPTTPSSMPLKGVLEGMMRASKNELTKVIADRYGLAGLNGQASALAMGDTTVNHHIGCGSPANYSTLVDFGKLHEAVIKGYLGAERENFYSIFAASFYGTGSYYAEGYLTSVIDQEATKAGLSSAEKSSFIGKMRVLGKKGGYKVSAGYHRAWAGYVKLPIWQNGGESYREYVTGAFVNSASSETQAIDAAAAGAAEVLRDEIRAAMLTLKGHVFGGFASFGSSCGGFSHQGAGTAELGQRVTYSANAANRRGTNLTSLEIGSSMTFWNRTPLPIHLGFMGANGCYWRTNSLVKVALPALNGQVAMTVLIPVDKTLLGLQLHTQFLIAEPGANAAGLTATNGLTTTIGGQK